MVYKRAIKVLLTINNIISHNLDTIYEGAETLMRLCFGELKQTWSSVCLWRTLDHRATGKTGQNHSCHDLVHLHWLWAAEAEDNIQEITLVWVWSNPHLRSYMFNYPSHLHRASLVADTLLRCVVGATVCRAAVRLLQPWSAVNVLLLWSSLSTNAFSAATQLCAYTFRGK